MITKEICLQEALKFKSRKEFEKNSPKIYKKANRNKWMREICQHMKVLCRAKYTIKELQQEALKYEKRSVFQKKSKGAYLAALRRGVLEDICQHMPTPIKPLTFLEIKEEALKFKSRKEFCKKSYRHYPNALKIGILDKVCAHMEPTRKSWNEKEFKKAIGKAIKKGMSKKQFEKQYKGAVRYAERNNLLQELEILRKKVHRWSDEDIAKCAKKCKTRSEFEAKFLGMYKSAIKRGIIEDVCVHMKQSATTSLAEKELFDTIKGKYPDTVKLKERKIQVKDKPWIYGFDIDIFIPSKNKGVEFDGEYWHDPKVMMGSNRKKKWPIEDVYRYHDIKDGYFKSEGIDILHIKEQDWRKNKDKCLSDIFKFIEN